MTKLPKIFLYLFVSLSFAIIPAMAKAAAFGFGYGNKNFDISQSELNSLKGKSILAPSPALLPLPPEPKNQLLQMLGQKSQTETGQKNFYRYKLAAVYDYINNLSPEIDATTTEPALTIENGRAVLFTPPQEGLKLDVYQSAQKALRALEAGSASVELVVYDTSPKTSLADLNSLGISELIAQGASNFSGSPKNRRHNIAVGVEKFKGVIVQKGEEFSFNKYLGEVDGEHGFLPELVIKKEGTVPEFGGGLCQVSSTAFRAAMKAGLPITQRKNHAYAVQYYSPQGTDATIYPGSVDLKFINDTPGAILIWPYVKDKNTLIFDFYGSKDSRRVILEKPVQWDRKVDGSMKASWTRTVAKDGEVSTSTFKSIYLPPALFHKTESFVSSTGTPASNLAPKPGQLQSN